MTASSPSFWNALAESLGGADGVVLTFGMVRYDGPTLLSETERWASILSELGVGAGDRVAVQAEKSIELILLYLATLRLAAIYIPLNTGYTDHEIEYFVADAEPVLLVRDADGCAISGVPVRALSGFAVRAAEVSVLPPPHNASADDLAAIVYTSGTTGRSKGAMISHGNLLANARALIETFGIRSNDRLLHALPLFHIHGLFVALNTLLLAGGRTDMLPAFDPDAVIAELPDATLFMGVPTYYSRLLADPRFGYEIARNIRTFICGSAPLTIATFNAFEVRTGQRILERYGMSECGIIASNPLAGERIAGSVGRPLPGFEVRIADNAEIGVLEVRGASVFAGYWRMPEKTRLEFRSDGFFITGDVATIDSDRVIRIVGRDKDMIISGGLNVYPSEIEERLCALPGVSDCAVIGLPHADFGEAVVAVVQPDDGAVLEPEALVAALRRSVASFKLPKAIFFVSKLPRNTMGKVQKAKLREHYAGHFGPLADI